MVKTDLILSMNIFLLTLFNITISGSIDQKTQPVLIKQQWFSNPHRFHSHRIHHGLSRLSKTTTKIVPTTLQPTTVNSVDEIATNPINYSSVDFQRFGLPLTTTQSTSDQSVTDETTVDSKNDLPRPTEPSFVIHSNHLTGDQRNIIKSNNLFCFKLYEVLGQLRSQDNLLISPLNLFTTLMTIYSGSSQATKQEMISVLNLQGMKERQVLPAFQSIMDKVLSDVKQHATFNLLSYLVVDDSLDISESFQDKIREYFYSYVIKVQFSSNSDHVASWLNEIVANGTQGMIPTIIDKAIGPFTKLLLINVIFFKGQWQEPFETDETTQGKFTNYDGSVSKVPMMRATSKFNYHCDYEKLQVCSAELLYLGGEISFLIMLPLNGTDLSRLESALDPQIFSEITESLTNTSLEIAIPRFSLLQSYDLIQPLKTLGMKTAFSAKNADLSRMGHSQELFIKDAKHKTAIQVTEEGTQVSAATFAIIGSRRRSIQFNVNRPFLFVIRHIKTNSILFFGRVKHLQ